MGTGVYQIRNTVNGKCYIGSAAGKGGFQARWNQHLHHLRHGTHHSAYLQNAWLKYGGGVFVFEILLYCDPTDCLTFEQLALDCYQPEYNINPNASSRLGAVLSDETKAKISRAHKGKRMSLKEAARLRTLACGVKRSQEHKKRISQTQKGKRKSEQQRIKQSQSMMGNQNRVGTKHTQATKVKIGDAHRGKVMSQESRSQISKTLRERGVNQGERSHFSKLNESDVVEIRHLLNEGIKQKVIAEQFGITHQTVSKIKHRLIWSHVTGGV